MIYIGFNYEGLPISIISCKNKEIANAYWQGLNQHPHSIKEFDLDRDRENEKQGFITPILKTEKKKFDKYSHPNGVECIVVVK